MAHDSGVELWAFLLVYNLCNIKKTIVIINQMVYNVI
jgi:hypothetical protein